MHEAVRLKADERGMEFFSNVYFAPDHRSADRNFYSLHKLLTLWGVGHYNVYAVMKDGAPIGLIHGTYTSGDFYGHVYFYAGYRGKDALIGIDLVMDRIKQHMKVNRFYANILKDNKAAQRFVVSAGYKFVSSNADDNTFVYEV
jgi:RimJ/RimL family protein N-acetyltransferase